MTLTHLSRLVSLSASTTLGIVDRLEAKELLRRDRDPQDRRKNVLTPTPAAAQIVRDYPLSLQDKLVLAVQKLPPDEQKAVGDSLERLVALLEELQQQPCQP